MISARLSFVLSTLMLSLAACVAPADVPPSQSQADGGGAPSTGGVAEGVNAFGLDLYKQIAAKDGNVFLSPVSISTAFGMVQAGARGETAAEIAATLHYPQPPASVHSDMEALLGALRVDEPGRKLTIANALWVQQGYMLRPDYRQLLSRHYGAEPMQLDFFGAREQAAAEINRWAERNTAGRIERLLSASDIDPDTRLVLTNAVYFNGDWLKPFKGGDTFPGDFRLEGGATTQVPFMHQTNRFRHLGEDDFQAIELPYRGEELSMIIFLPEARDGLAAFERRLTASRLENWTRRLRASDPVEVVLSMPKLKLETRYDLPDPLQALGMRLAFTNAADLSGITDAERLKIDKVIHQTFLAIDEEGTEAAAATAITIVPVGARIGPPPIEFRADRPFFFLIRDNRSGAIVFLGRIKAPPPAD